MADKTDVVAPGTPATGRKFRVMVGSLGGRWGRGDEIDGAKLEEELGGAVFQSLQEKGVIVPADEVRDASGALVPDERNVGAQFIRDEVAGAAADALGRRPPSMGGGRGASGVTEAPAGTLSPGEETALRDASKSGGGGDKK